MRKIFGTLIAAGLLAGLLACNPGGTEDTVLLRVPDDPTVTFKVWFSVGSQDDPAGKEGLAYLTGQMLSDGATTKNSYEEILRKLYPLASSYSVRVDREMTVLTGRTHRDNLEAFYALYTDAYLHPQFKDEDFDRLKTNALNYLKNQLRYAQDEELAKATLHDFVFEGTRYAHPPQGRVQSLESMTVDDVKGFFQKHYNRGNATIALGGGFDRELVRRFRGSVEGLPEAQEIDRPAIAPPAIEGRQVRLVAKADADSSISFGFPIDVKRGERDFYALWIANSWLGEHRNSSSHLFQVIRERRGMNYGDYSYIEAFPQGGYRSFPPTHVARNHQLFEVWIRTLPNTQAHFALRAAMREVESLVNDGMTEEEFELTRGFLKKYVLHFADTTTTRLGYAVDDRFYGIDGEGHLSRFRKMMDEITRDEVNAALKKHLQIDSLKIAVVTGDAEGFAAALAAEAASPMTYASEKSAEILAEDNEIATYALGIGSERIDTVAIDSVFER